MRKLLLSIIIAFITHTGLKARHDCSFTHYSVRDGLSQNTVSCIFQDSKGYMWFGTFNGLNKFDGYRFRHYKTISDRNETVTDGRIDHITEDASGIIWITTHDGRVFRLDSGSGVFYPVADREPDSKAVFIKEVLPMPSGNMWLITDNSGCFMVSPGKEPDVMDVAYFSRHGSPLPSDRVVTVLSGDNGCEYAVTSRGFLVLGVDSGTTAVKTEQSMDDIRCAVFDEGRIWCGFSNGRVGVFDTANGSWSDAGISATADITAITVFGDRMLILTDGDGFAVTDKAGRFLKKYNSDTHPEIISDRLSSVFVDSRNEAWIEMGAPGILHFDPARDEVRQLTQEVDRAGIYAFSDWAFTMEDINGNLWVYPKGGGFSLYDRRSRTLEHFHNKPGDAGSRFSNVIFQAFSDRQGNLWMSTYSRGLEKISFPKSPLRNIQPSPMSSAPAENEVRAIAQQRNGMIWLACRDGSLYRSGPHLSDMRRFSASGGFDNGRPFNSFVYDILEDGSGRIWFATRNNGIYMLTPRGTDNYGIENFRYSAADAYSVSSDIVYSIYEDVSGRVWFGTWNGGLNYADRDKDGRIRFINYRNGLKEYPADRFTRVRKVKGDAEGNIWAATTQGVVRLKDDGNGGFRVETYRHVPGDHDSPPANDIHDIEFCGDTVWLATFGAGLCRFIPQGTAPRFASFNTGNGFPADIILTLVKTSGSRLWMNSENEIIKFDPSDASHDVFDNYVPGSSADIYFSEGAALQAHDGSLVFGHSNGAYKLEPEGAGKSTYRPDMTLSRLLLFNREVMPSEKGSPLSANLDATESIRLNHRQSVFSIEFAALDLSNPQAVMYAYKLEGFDKAWNYVGGQRTATYTNLPYGKYTFMVRSTNADKVWADNTRRLHIEIMPPFWKTGWAYFLYALALAVILYIGSRIILSFLRLRNEVDIEHRVTEMKLKFFTDISHEIRTPLTLISSPVEHLLETEELPEQAVRTLGTVKLNTDRLLRLVNQLLDFRKIQNHRMKLYIEKISIGVFTHQVCRNFEREALEREISFTFSDYSDGEEIWGDQDKIEKILFNLLSNSFKFTPDGGRIGCTVRNDINQMSITVSDEGGGIPDDVLRNLFVRFSSSDEKRAKDEQKHQRFGKARTAGTGIGLSLTKELVDLLGGEIFVDSRKGAGTDITVTLNKEPDYFAGLPECTIKEEPDTAAVRETHNAPEAAPEGTYTVLFIEDNPQLRDFLRTVASKDYRVLEAPDGETGLETARAEQPDIIVSDIMMEGIDGLETVRRLRADISTSHIPVILLTAKSDLGDKLEAMKLGADDYITKPFSAAYLLARMANILDQRAKLRGFYTSEEGMRHSGNLTDDGGAAQPPAISVADSEFMSRLTGYMENNLSDPDLKIDNLLSLFCISYSLLFKKMKSLTGLSPVEYIREFRIRRAAELIRQGEFNNKQITYMVGMNDSRYFSRCFKQTFGMTPSEYRAKHQ